MRVISCIAVLNTPQSSQKILTEKQILAIINEEERIISFLKALIAS